MRMNCLPVLSRLAGGLELGWHRAGRCGVSVQARGLHVETRDRPALPSLVDGNKKRPEGLDLHACMAETVRFELTEGYQPSALFKSAALNRSATFPVATTAEAGAVTIVSPVALVFPARFDPVGPARRRRASSAGPKGIES